MHAWTFPLEHTIKHTDAIIITHLPVYSGHKSRFDLHARVVGVVEVLVLADGDDESDDEKPTHQQVAVPRSVLVFVLDVHDEGTGGQM